MDVDRLQAIIDWMQRSPLLELEVTDGTFRARLVRGTTNELASSVAPYALIQNAGTEITAPSYGVVHLSSAPDAAPFVTVGSRVEAGQPLCVIEAMKVFTQIDAQVSGTVAAIFVADGAEVSAGQLIMRLD